MQTDHATLARLLVEARARTRRMTEDLAGERLLGPKLDIVNPPLWEIGHVGWFQERWCLRTVRGGLPVDSIRPGADALYDSSAVPHDTRWDLPLPGLAATLDYLDDPGYMDASANDYRLRPDSPAVDAGVVVPGVSDSFNGTAPDLGYREFR